MLKRVRIRGYRCFRDVDVELKPLQVLVGPNGSGKSAFLDAIRFVRDVVRHHLRGAMRMRVWKPEELFWKGQAREIEIQLTWGDDSSEARGSLPGEVIYEIALQRGEGKADIVREHLSWAGRTIYRRTGPEIRFEEQPGVSWRVEGDQAALRTLFEFTPEPLKEIVKGLQGWWLKAWPEFLHPEPRAIRRGIRRWEEPRHQRFYPNARDLPLLIQRMKEVHPEAYQYWLDEIRSLIGQHVELQPHHDEVAGIFRLAMKWNGVWLSPSGISEGWLRFIALSLYAYDPENEGCVFFIEEIENGLSPDSIDALFGIMVETPAVQWLVTSQHPLLVRLAGPQRLLIFSREEGEAQVLPGSQHPLLRDLEPGADLAVLFLAHILS